MSVNDVYREPPAPAAAPPPQPWICSKCDPSFGPIKVERKYHNRVVHQAETKAHYPGEESEVFERLFGIFSCKRCIFTHPDPTRLQGHTRKCNVPNPDTLSSPTPSPAHPAHFPRQERPETVPNSPVPSLGLPRPSFPAPPTPHLASQPHPRTIDDFPVISASEFLRSPEPTTITTHPNLPLRAYGIVINMDLGGVIICVNCGRCITPNDAYEHIHAHFIDLDLPPNLGDILERTFKLRSLRDIKPPKPFGPPIYGLTLYPDALRFCTRCGHGFSNERSLRSHQSSQNCPRIANEGDEHFISYGQGLGFTSAMFSVDITRLTRRDESDVDPAQIYTATYLPTPDYSQLPVSLPVNNQDLDQFFHREGWIEHLAGVTPQAINALVDLPDEKQHHWLPRLRDYIMKYLGIVQRYIKRHTSHGLMRKMAQVGLTETCDELRALERKSLNEYGRELVRLLFNLLQQVNGEVDTTYYPLTPQQRTGLENLYPHLVATVSHPTLAAPILHDLLFHLFAHAKTSGSDENFSLPVLCYLVARSMGRTEWIRTSEIGRVVAKLMWLTRGVSLYEMEAIMLAEKLRSIDAYQRIRMYITDGEETVFSYLYNTSALIKSIRGEEYTEAHSRMADLSGRQLQFKSDMINLDDFALLHNGLRSEYNKIIAKEIFFGQPIPDWFKIDIDIRSLVDEPRNNTAGYGMIDHPQNGFVDKFKYYGAWLLSCPIRAAEFVDIIDGSIAWKSAPCYRLLNSFVRARRLLCTRKIVDVGTSVRATEISRDLLRNLSGGSIRSVLILYHILCVVGIQDKTSHKILKKRFTPGAPTTDTAVDLVKNLVFFRRFESDLIRNFRGDQDAERYNIYLWPDIPENISGESISEDLGEATEKYLGVSLGILDWRNVTTAFQRHHDPEGENDADHGYDLLSNHSSRTSEQRYGIDRATLANAPTHHITACLKATIKWQHLTRIQGEKPLRLTTSPLPTVLLPDVAAEGNHIPNALTRYDVTEIVRETLGAQQAENALQIKTTLTSLFTELATIHLPPPPPRRFNDQLPRSSSVIVDPSRLRAFRQFLKNDEADFRFPAQGELIELMIARQRHILGILACDVGKTTIIMFLAKTYDASLITVVILPLTGLYRDFHERAIEYDLRVATYNPQSCNSDAAQIIYVSVELAVGDTFLEYAEGLQNSGRLARLSRHDKTDRAAGDQDANHGLSATIPEHMMLDLCAITGIDSWDVIRMPTQRPNIAYAVKLHSEATYKKKAVNYITQRLEYYKPDDRAVVYCRTKGVATEIANLLGTKPYTSNTPVAEREALFAAWMHGDARILVGTTIISCGINRPGVRDVVHVDVGHSLIDQFQEDCRGGRNGTRARAIYFVPENRAMLPAIPGQPFGAELLVPWAKNRDDCRRIVPSAFLDGKPVTCIDLRNAELCDNCLRKYDDKARVPPSIPIRMPMADYHAPTVPNAAQRLIYATKPIAPRSPNGQGRKSVPAPPIAPLPNPNTNGHRQHTIPVPAVMRHPPNVGNAQKRPVPPAPATARNPQIDDTRQLAQAGMRSPPNDSNRSSAHNERASRATVSRTHASNSVSDRAPASRSGAATMPAAVASTMRDNRIRQPVPRSMSNSPSNASRGGETVHRTPDSDSDDGPEVFGVGLPLPKQTHSVAPVRQRKGPAEGLRSPPITGDGLGRSDSIVPPPPAAPVVHRADVVPVQQAGLPIQILHRQRHNAVQDAKAFYNDISAALLKLKAGCPACWGRGKLDWSLHTLKKCQRQIATAGDEFWDSWHAGAHRKLLNYCFACCRPQWRISRISHPYIADMSLCPWADIIKAAFYAWVTAPVPQEQGGSFFIQEVGVPEESRGGFEDVWDWAVAPEPNAEEGITNLLRLFHRLILHRRLL
ncbi:hypothetical protein C8R43DRAFT_1136784 [Mycena crocata]|nr:hypothetical protein C8R43DRAFT_1136784 [Mycena crocata]